tara:strand:- start:134 stop:529 length:396 start_codon:yes stop_codon:yes gene_type:complete
MLVFGSSIGEGNYTRPVNEIVTCEKSIGIIGSYSLSSDTDFNLEAETDGKIPKGVKAFQAIMLLTPSTIDKYFTFESASSNSIRSFLTYSAHGTYQTPENFLAICDSNGDFRLERNGTFTVQLNAVQIHLR